MPKGRVFKGQEFVADVEYQHSTRQNYQVVNTLEGTGRVPTSCDVYLRITPVAAVSPYCATMEMLTLHMDDGKNQDFYVTSSGGACKATGGPY